MCPRKEIASAPSCSSIRGTDDGCGKLTLPSDDAQDAHAVVALPNLIGSGSSLWRKRKGIQAPLMKMEKFTKKDECEEIWLAPEISEKYAVKDVLGSGSMAVVHRASLRGPRNQEVALKVLKARGNPEMVQLARQEFELLKRLPPHPHIIQAFDFHEIPRGGVVMALELFDGLTLQKATLAAPEKKLSPACVSQLSTALFKALAHLHSHGVIHRDVKPCNIFVSRSLLDLRLGDFNVARSLEDGASLSPAGDPIYRAPEVSDGAACSEQSDVWSAGLSMFFALTGALLHWRRSRHVENEEDYLARLSYIEGISLAFENSLRSALNHAAQERPPASELASEEAWAL
jgi:serine/threonine protein kinase